MAKATDHCAVRDGKMGTVEDIVERYQSKPSDKRAKEIAKEYGLTFINRGKSRAVWQDTSGSILEGGRSCVIKVSEMGHTYQNETEVKNFLSYRDKLGKILAPVGEYDDGYRWLTMKYAPGEATLEDRIQLEKVLYRNGFRYEDTKLENIGFIDGHPVLVDLGVPIEDFGQGEMTEDEIASMLKFKHDL